MTHLTQGALFAAPPDRPAAPTVADAVRNGYIIHRAILGGWRWSGPGSVGRRFPAELDAIADLRSHLEQVGP